MRLLLAALTLIGAWAAAQSVPTGDIYGPVPVALVTDGDTLVVASNAGPRTVRLIGIDAPEPGQASSLGRGFAARATAFLSSLLPVGTPVWLELDEGETDAYGRLLAYVYLEDPSGEWLIGADRVRQLNLLAVEAGLASVLTVAPNATYRRLYEDAEERARSAGVGMWGAQGAVAAQTPARLPISIRCALFNPDTPNDTAGEWVSLLIFEPFDTSGLYLLDEGSKSVFVLPSGVQPAGELRIDNPGQGVWNNSGDVIYLMRNAEVIDSWRYSGQSTRQGAVVCRSDPGQ